MKGFSISKYIKGIISIVFITIFIISIIFIIVSVVVIFILLTPDKQVLDRKSNTYVILEVYPPSKYHHYVQLKNIKTQKDVYVDIKSCRRWQNIEVGIKVNIDTITMNYKSWPIKEETRTYLDPRQIKSEICWGNKR